MLAVTNYTKNYARTFDKGLTPVHTLIKTFKLTKIPCAERIQDTNLVLDVYPGGGGGAGVIPGKSWWGLLPDPISDKKMSFSTSFFRPGLKNRGLFLDLKLL